MVELDEKSFLVAALEASEGLITVWRVEVPDSPEFLAQPGVLRDTPPITATRLMSVPGTVGANGVSLEVGPTLPTGACGMPGRSLALGFHTGCGALAKQSVALLGADRGGNVCLQSPPAVLGTFENVAKPTTLSALFVPQGLVREGFARGGRTADAASTGGWLLAWTSTDAQRRTQVVISRALALDGAPLQSANGRPEQLVVKVNTDSPHFFVDAENAQPRLAYRVGAGAGLETLPATCGAR